jgi:antitoxin (DNA-binding transcriptional repressor) of toxin-antitoxin stability system
MTTKIVDVDTTKMNIQELALLIRTGDEVILTTGNEPLARVVPMETTEKKPGKRTPGLFPGIWMSDDFDDELPDSFWLGEDEI